MVDGRIFGAEPINAGLLFFRPMGTYVNQIRIKMK